MLPKEHHYSLDLIRLLAAFGIVTIHTCSYIFNFYGRLPLSSWFISHLLVSLFRWGTPVFIMISGYLLLNSSSVSSPATFYRRRLDKILIPLIFWNLFYYLFSGLSNGSTNLSISGFTGNFISSGTFYHLYFLFLISGLYLITPFLKKLIDRGLNLNMAVPILILTSYLYYLGSTWLNWKSLDEAISWFILYIGYYLAGYWLPRQNFQIKKVHLIIFLLLPIIGSIVGYYFISQFGTGDRGIFLTHRLSPLISIPAGLIFIFILKIKNSFFVNHNLTWLKNYADLGMGIYLIHPLIIEGFANIIPLRNLMWSLPILWITITVLISFLMSLLLIRLIKLVPIINRLV